ncbi:MAG: chaperone modulator CbpM [Actinomycetota bacterium]|nr:chaperone modulator CbpM [Actinomycetota bacterium]
MTYTLVRRSRAQLLDLDTFARRARLHPDLVRRLIALGLLEAERDGAGALWLAPAELATVARIQRLRAGFSLNYAAVGLVLDLLDRIEALEAALRRQPARTAAHTNTPTTITRTFIGG